MPDEPIGIYEEDRNTQRIREATEQLQSLAQPVVERRQAQMTPEERAAKEMRQRQEPVPGSLEMETFERSASTLAAAGLDVARGTTEAPGQVLGGIVELPDDIVDMTRGVEDFMLSMGEQVGIPEAAMLGPVIASREGERGSGVAAVTQRLRESVGPADTVTGDLVRKTTNFFTAFVPFMGPAGRLAKFQKGAGVSRRIARDAMAGAAADFVTVDLEPIEAAAEELMQDPTIGSQVMAFFEGEPGDPELERRLKQTLLGAGLGIAADGLVQGFRALRAARRARQNADQIPGPIREAAERPPLDTRLTDLPPEGPMIEQRSLSEERLQSAIQEVEQRFAGQDVSRQQIRRLAEAEATDIEINFDRIQGPEDLAQLMQDATDLFTPSLTKARRGVRSNEATKEAADLLGLDVDAVLSRRGGQALNAEESLAFRRIHTAAADRLLDAAQAVTLDPSSPAAQIQMRRMLSIFHAINREVLGARAEAGRALQQWRIPAGSDEMRARMISDLLDAKGGPKVGLELAKRLTRASDTTELSVMVERGWMATTADAVKEAFVLGKLWTPSTHAVNMVSNSLVGVQQIYERIVARGVSKIAGREGVEAGEIAAMTLGWTRGVRAAFRIGEQNRQFREAALEATGSRDKLDVRTNAISSEAFGLRNLDGTPTTIGKFADYYGAFTRAPGTMLQKEDEFFKTIGYTMELHAQAARQAAREGAENGWSRSQLDARYADLVRNPTDAIRLEAADAALYDTFQQKSDGRAMRMAFAIRDNVPGSYLVLPFVRTPVNIFRYTFERTPAAPLVGQWREDFVAGGARRDIALARMATGSAITLSMFDIVWEGHASGGLSTDQGIKEVQLRQNLQPDSLIIGEPGNQHTLRLSRLDPIGFQLSVMGTFAEVLKSRELDDEDLDEVSEIIGMMAVATTEATRNKTWLAGVSRLMAALEDPSQFAPRLIETTAGAMVPHSTLFTTIGGLTSEEMPDTNSLWDEIERNVDGLAQRLPRKRNLWGQTIVVDSVNKLSPIRIEKVEAEPIDEELLRLGSGPLRIPKKSHFNGGALMSAQGMAPAQSVPVSFREFPEVYEAYVTLAGGGTEDGLVHPGTGQRLLPLLNGMVEGTNSLAASYQLQGPVGKDRMIRRWINRYRELSQREILQDPQGRFQGEQFQRFRRYIADKKMRQQSERMPQLFLEPEPEALP